MASENWDYYFSQQIAVALDAARESGFALPWHVAVIGANGALIYCRFDPTSDETFECTFLSEHLPDTGGLQAPVNIVLVDSNGEAMRMLIRPISSN